MMKPMSHLIPSSRQMWIAYAIAPAAAPATFVCLTLGAGVVGQYTGVEVNSASLVVLPIAALTVGLAASYLVAGLLGMPIAFALRRWRALNVLTIHLAAFIWACVFAWFSRHLVGGDGVPAGGETSWFVYLLIGIAPPTLLSAFVFWLLVRRHHL